MKIELHIFTWVTLETSKRIPENIHSLRHGHPPLIFVTIARDLQIILLNLLL